MGTLIFKPSPYPFSLGVELELQLIDPATGSLVSCAQSLLDSVRNTAYRAAINPEMTQSMIELNSSIHQNPHTLLAELTELKHFLLQQAENLNIQIAGGGTHPFQHWSAETVFPSSRFRHCGRLLGYLSQSFTVFSLHVHIGCEDADAAIYLCHMLAAYVPFFIALSASSPFYHSVDTTYASSRTNIVNNFLLNGTMPYVRDWSELTAYFERMRWLGIIETMKDFHWDIRPKPETGTVEVRVCDMPLTLSKCIAIAAYLQTLCYFLFTTKPALIGRESYDLYAYNRFQASRFGFTGDYIGPFTEQHFTIKEAMLLNLGQIESSARILNNAEFIEKIRNDVVAEKSDAEQLRAIFKQTKTFDDLVRAQCQLWEFD